MPDITITITTELANRLRVKYGTLNALRDQIVATLRQEILQDALAQKRRALFETATAPIEAAVETERSTLEAQL